MSTSLAQATEHLYQTFSAYPCNPKIEGCSDSVSDFHQHLSLSGSLNTLGPDELSRYLLKTITTAEEVEAFKYYLPRIFELAAYSADFLIDHFVIFSKLEYGHWRTWPEAEQVAIESFLWVWWKHTTRRSNGFNERLLFEIHQVSGQLESLLDQWTWSVNDCAFLNFIVFLEWHLHDLQYQKGPFKKLSKKEYSLMTNWVNSKATDFEAGFFHWERNDPSWAKRISDMLYVLEQTHLLH